jgi:hypothetical protein
MAQVIQNASQAWVTPQYRPEQRPVASADVRQNFDATEIVGVQHGVCLVTVKRRHSIVEQRSEFRVCADVVEKGSPIHLLKAKFASLHCMVKPVPGSEHAVKHLLCVAGRNERSASLFRAAERGVWSNARFPVSRKTS